MALVQMVTGVSMPMGPPTTSPLAGMAHILAKAATTGCAATLQQASACMGTGVTSRMLPILLQNCALLQATTLLPLAAGIPPLLCLALALLLHPAEGLLPVQAQLLLLVQALQLDRMLQGHLQQLDNLHRVCQLPQTNCHPHSMCQLTRCETFCKAR